jgi:transposase
LGRRVEEGLFRLGVQRPSRQPRKSLPAVAAVRRSLENPPLLVVSEIQTSQIHTNFTNSVKQVTTFALDHVVSSLLRASTSSPSPTLAPSGMNTKAPCNKAGPVAERTQASRFVFVDECSTNTSLSPLYACSPIGQRARCKVPRNYGPNVTLFASMTHKGMGPCLLVEGATTSEVFETYSERMLGPALRPGQIVVMDNLSSHKGERVRELIEERGCELLYLPPYSPDLNPIEEAFAKLEALLRRAAARSHEALVESMGAALDAINTQDAHAAPLGPAEEVRQ